MDLSNDEYHLLTSIARGIRPLRLTPSDVYLGEVTEENKTELANAAMALIKDPEGTTADDLVAVAQTGEVAVYLTTPDDVHGWDDFATYYKEVGHRFYKEYGYEFDEKHRYEDAGIA